MMTFLPHYFGMSNNPKELPLGGHKYTTTTTGNHSQFNIQEMLRLNSWSHELWEKIRVNDIKAEHFHLDFSVCVQACGFPLI